MRVLVERPHRVAAQERKELRVCELVPQDLQTDRQLAVPILPEEIDHLAVDSDRAARPSAARSLDDGGHHVRECVRIEPAVRDDRREGVPRVEQDEVGRLLL